MDFEGNVVVFAGGTGSISLLDGLRGRLRPEQITVIVNAYDDGKSTGRIRHALGMLGPSDIAKNLGNLIDLDHPQRSQLLEVFGARVSSHEQLMAALYTLPRSSLLEGLRRYALKFSQEYPDFDYTDCAVRNVIYAGAFIAAHRDYQIAIDELRALLGIRSRLLLSSTQNLWLAAVTKSGKMLRSEAEIVQNSYDEVHRLFLLEHPIQPADVEHLETAGDAYAYLAARHVTPQMDARAVEAIADAERIVYGSSTLDSSLLPTLMAKGCIDAISQNPHQKVLVANLVHERGSLFLSDHLAKLESVASYFDCSAPDIVDTMVVSTLSNNGRNLHVDRAAIEKQFNVEVVGIDLEGRAGQHHPSRLADEILGFTLAHWRPPFPSKSGDNAVPGRQMRRPLRLYRVIVCAAGEGQRFHGGTKALQPILGRPSILHVLDVAKTIDPGFIVVTTPTRREVKRALEEAGYGGHIVESHMAWLGNAATLLYALPHAGEEAEDIVVMWCDTPNIQVESVLNVLQVHSLAVDSAVTFATAEEDRPYVSVQFDEDDNPLRFIQSPGTSGHHDAGFFVCNRRFLRTLLSGYLNRVTGKGTKPNSLHFIDALNNVTAYGAFMTWAGTVTPEEAASFNTVEDVARVEECARALQSKKESACA